MKLRFFSPNIHKYRTAKNFGAVLFLVGFLLLIDGHGSEDIILTGVLMLIWSAISRYAYRRDPDQSVHWLQSLWYSIVFIIAVVICSVFIAYFPSLIASGTLSPYATVIVIILFLFFLFL